MSVKTRLQALERRLAQPEQRERAVRVEIIEVSTREQVERLRAAGTLDSPPSPILPGRVRLELLAPVTADDF